MHGRMERMGVYLDHAATTPLRPEARDAWLRASDLVGNASSVHGAGREARRIWEESREELAQILDCEPVEVVFTSGGTESITTALQGLWASRPADAVTVVLPDGEHHATLETVAALRRSGAQVRSVALDQDAVIELSSFAAALPGAALATALVANNEVGTIQDVQALSAAAASAGVPLHLDAVAAFGQMPLSFSNLRGESPAGAGLVALSVAGHKIGAAAGTGVLVVARTARITPVLHGGAAQRDIRPGTADVPGAASLAAAARAAHRDLEEQVAQLRILRDRLIQGILATVPQAQLLGHPTQRLPGNAHILFPGAPGESLLFLLDQVGVSVSIGSACQAGVAEPSHVVQAMGFGALDARSVLRFSLGWSSSAQDIDAVLTTIGDAYDRASGARRHARS